MRISLIVIAALLTLAGAAVCSAQPLETGPYLSGFIGAGAFKDTRVTSENYYSGSIFNDKVEFDPGINAGLTGGYNFGFLRLEGELSYKGSGISDITDQYDYYRFHNVEGDAAVFAMMANGFLDLRNSTPVTPYIGGGAGYATVYLSDTYVTDTRDGYVTRDYLYLEDAAPAFAYQLGGGLSIALNKVLSLDLGYRYFCTSKAKFEDAWNGRTEFKVKSHNAAVGLRVQF